MIPHNIKSKVNTFLKEIFINWPIDRAVHVADLRYDIDKNEILSSLNSVSKITITNSTTYNGARPMQYTTIYNKNNLVIENIKKHHAIYIMDINTMSKLLSLAEGFADFILPNQTSRTFGFVPAYLFFDTQTINEISRKILL